ncbi:hypothetical protein EMIHUDRAFT_212834 [Emiliania huxleyi CCMP1516]|nr:hypothetical protein EMIHUDRAFT_212834 [Emiliania huxleyi CCMP1516]EOD13114.1 hypothetical protein EMIHUDRAFT_212834 [Emiliania huxleyi CCMP1516]|eukprot:XP_005765543.1 hypothetical protein EMIHUDRAFT_212834 [Emiliania huxleyi CCMP1516]
MPPPGAVGAVEASPRAAASSAGALAADRLAARWPVLGARLAMPGRPEGGDDRCRARPTKRTERPIWAGNAAATGWPRTGLGTGQVWILHGAAVYLRAHGAFRGGPFLAKSRYHIACGRRKTACSPVWDLFVRLQKPDPLLNDDYAARRSICAFSAVEGM